MKNKSKNLIKALAVIILDVINILAHVTSFFSKK
jgi:hypothetical protein